MDNDALTPRGNETMTQSDDSQSVDASNLPKEGLPIFDGKFRRYGFYGIIFDVPVRYVPIEPIGRGAYGVVCSAKDVTTGEEVAIKKIGRAFTDMTDAKRTLREIVLLRNMKHPNVIAIKDLIRPPNPRDFKDVYVVYELMPTDLHEVIRSNQPMDERHFRFILYQLLRALKYIHSANVLHRDLKPPNILIDARCNVKITDFGLARTSVEADSHMTEYVVTRYYRAPELLVNNQQYTGAVDVWSIGLIFLELVKGDIVLRGENYVDQLRRTCELIGSPSNDDVSFIANEAARTFILTELAGFPKRDFREVFPKLSELGADLAQKMLIFDPRSRITVEESLAHPYLAQYHRPNQEPGHPNPFSIDLSFELEEFGIPRIRQLVYEQACIFNPDP